MTVGRSAALSDPGRRRRRNEDAYVLQPPLFAVADGMGGAQAGEVASRLAVEALKEAGDGGEAVERVAALVQAANRRIWERAGEDASAQGMGTTMTVALVEEGEVAIGHVGDSRAYRIRDGRVEQLTDDHSLVAELMRSGKLSPEEADAHPQRSVITRALGTDPDVDVDTLQVDARPGDVFLLCSDGLTIMVDEEEILEEVERSRGDLEGAAKALVRRANRGGGEDNITVVFFEIVEEAAAEHTEVLLPAEPEPDEDTLDELDGIRPLERPRATDTIVVPPERAAMIGTEPNPLDRTAKRVLVTVLVLLMLAALAVVVFWWGLAS
ncbi:MAG: Stp1/IreP family PP2C-type Ser/Thr phosphatase [Actinomycetota bacterium]|nr:Stp1/IreP family PP2C-type Ser/Thr phosphatase [Actinomycetota bacterium]